MHSPPVLKDFVQLAATPVLTSDLDEVSATRFGVRGVARS
jgi:hypothetical protein